MLKAFDHVNVRTTNLDGMVAWYGEVLGMHPGWRPPFDFPGAWLYLGDHALIHLVGVETPPEAPSPGLEHIAFRAEGRAAFVAKLEAAGVPMRPAQVPGTDITQINIHDPDGNHIHVDFTD